MAEDAPPTVNQLREEAGLTPLTPEQEQATQDMVDLTQELLGLYDDPRLEELRRADAAAVLDDDLDDDPALVAYAVQYADAVAELHGLCPFCGAAEPCPSHRAGG